MVLDLFLNYIEIEVKRFALVDIYVTVLAVKWNQIAILGVWLG